MRWIWPAELHTEPRGAWSRSFGRQHLLYFLPLPQGQGSFLCGFMSDPSRPHSRLDEIDLSGNSRSTAATQRCKSRRCPRSFRQNRALPARSFILRRMSRQLFFRRNIFIMVIAGIVGLLLTMVLTSSLPLTIYGTL